MKQQLKKLADRFAAYHFMKAKRAKADGDEEMQQAHIEMAEECTKFGKLLAASAKAAGMSGDVWEDLPANIRAFPPTAPPTATAIPRVGSPPLAQKTAVPLEFQKLVSVEEEN